jgi:TPR repeat protein
VQSRVCYWHGRGVATDEVKAVELCTRGAEAGDIDSIVNQSRLELLARPGRGEG